MLAADMELTMTTRTSAGRLEHLVSTARAWLDDIAEEMDSEDAEATLRVTRTWLHAVRDRLPVIESAHFAAQLPDLLRGVYFEGWRPAEVPVRTHAQQLIHDVAADTHLAVADVPQALHDVSVAMDRHLTNLDKVLQTAPSDVRQPLQP